MDYQIFRWINGQAGLHSWLDHAILLLASSLPFVLVLTLLAGWVITTFLFLRRHGYMPQRLLAMVLLTAVALGVALLCNWAIGHWWFRPRPYDAHPTATLLVAPSPDPSFPSDHAAAAFALAFGAAWGIPRLGLLVVVEAIALSLARVYVGLHYPGDIAGGVLTAAFGFSVGLGVVRLLAGPLQLLAGLVSEYRARFRWPWRIQL